MGNIDAEVLRQVLDENRRCYTIVRPVIPSMEVAIIRYLEYFLLECFRNIEAFTTFLTGKVYQTFSFSKPKPL